MIRKHYDHLPNGRLFIDMARQQGLSQAQIARMYNTIRQAVHYRMKQAGYEPKPQRVRRPEPVYQFIIDYFAKHNQAPLRREIMAEFKINSNYVLDYLLEELESRGLIERNGKKRGIRVLKKGGCNVI